MSDTPRTDVQEHKDGNEALIIVDADFARQLERELTAAEAENAAMREAIKCAHLCIESKSSEMIQTALSKLQPYLL